MEGYKWLTLREFVEATPDIQAAQEVEELYPNFTGVWCRFLYGVSTGMSLNEDVVHLVHAPLGCTSAGRNFLLTHLSEAWGQGFPHIPQTNMGNSQVIMGGEDDLRQAILAVDRDYKPALIIVYVNCCAGLIGDNVDEVISSVKDEIKSKIIHIPTEGFSSCWCGESIHLIAPKFIEIMDPPSKIIKNSVNILGMHRETFCTFGEFSPDPYFKEDELVRYVKKLGLIPHRVLISGSYDYIRTAPEAQVNALNCPTFGYPMAWAMEEKFGTPYLRHALPIGVKATENWIRELAKFSGREEEGERLISTEYEMIREDWEMAMHALEGRVALIEGGRNTLSAFAKAMAYARMSMELGMTPYLFNLHPLEVKAKPQDYNYFLEEGCNPMILMGSYPYSMPVSLSDVMKDLGLDRDQVIYFINDVYPFARAGAADPSDTARVDSSIHHRRKKRDVSRGVGFRASKEWAGDLLIAAKTSQRKREPTLYGRLFGEAFDF